jgi:secondary thiamine-phosphate synthase enzyme
MAMTLPCSTRSCFFETSEHQVERETHILVAREFVLTSETITINTGEAPHFIDLTDTVQEIITRQGIIAGSALVFSKHTTAAIVLNEHEPLLLEDISDLLTRLIPHTDSMTYRHDDFEVRTVNMTIDEKENGHAHCRHLFLGGNIQVPIRAGRLDLGRWQRIFLVELDRPRTRQVVVQLTGVLG